MRTDVQEKLLQVVNQASLLPADSIPSPSFSSPILLFSPASPPLHLHLLHLPIFIPLPLPQVTGCSKSRADAGSNTWEIMGARRGKEDRGCFIIVVEIKLNQLRDAVQNFRIRETLTLLASADSITEITPLINFSALFFVHFLAPLRLILRLMPMEGLRAIARTN